MIITLNNKNIDYAIKMSVNIIKDGGVIIAPTDTVYGFLADAFNLSAVQKIYEIKGREANKPFLIIIKDKECSKSFSDIEIPKKILEFIPGKITFIMPLKKSLETELVYLKDTVALRVPDNNFINKILNETPPLVAPSANPKDYGIINDGNKIIELYEDKVDLIINNGIIKEGLASTLYDCINDKVIREGSIKIL